MNKKGNFLLQFAEQPTEGGMENGLVEYSSNLNLNVFKGTQVPAITLMGEATETFTKADTEGSDSDHDRYQQSLSGTETNTFDAKEGSDSDRGVKGLLAMMATETFTEARETTDRDK